MTARETAHVRSTYDGTSSMGRLFLHDVADADVFEDRLLLDPGEGIDVVVSQSEDGTAVLTGYLDAPGLTALRQRLDVLERGSHVHLEDLLDGTPSASGRPVAVAIDLVFREFAAP